MHINGARCFLCCISLRTWQSPNDRPIVRSAAHSSWCNRTTNTHLPTLCKHSHITRTYAHGYAAATNTHTQELTDWRETIVSVCVCVYECVGCVSIVKLLVRWFMIVIGVRGARVVLVCVSVHVGKRDAFTAFFSRDQTNARALVCYSLVRPRQGH